MKFKIKIEIKKAKVTITIIESIDFTGNWEELIPDDKKYRTYDGSLCYKFHVRSGIQSQHTFGDIGIIIPVNCKNKTVYRQFDTVLHAKAWKNMFLKVMKKSGMRQV